MFYPGLVLERKVSGSRKNTPYAAQLRAETAAKAAHEMYKVDVFVKGLVLDVSLLYAMSIWDWKSILLSIKHQFHTMDAVHQT